MTDRELLELVAKAAGIAGHYVTNYNWDYYYRGNTEGILLDGPDGCWDVGYVWNPLDDDGDALRLAVKLNLRLVHHPALNQVLVRPYHSNAWEDEVREDCEKHPDPYAATRRAIVRAAAEIGRNMK